MSEIQTAREAINKVDKEMARLFELRMDAAGTIAKYKKENGIPIDDLEREKEIINRNANYIENEEYRSYSGFVRNDRQDDRRRLYAQGY